MLAEVGRKYIMVLIDYYSRFPITEVIHSTSANVVIPRLDDLLATSGVPRILKSDNGPPFNSKVFSSYMGIFTITFLLHSWSSSLMRNSVNIKSANYNISSFLRLHVNNIVYMLIIEQLKSQGEHLHIKHLSWKSLEKCP